METRLCKNCKHWNYGGHFDGTSHFRVCTNEKVFINKPKGMQAANKIFSSSLSGVYTNDVVYGHHVKDEPIATGENFGCIHFEQRPIGNQ